jgi:hypothetical protein
MVKVKYSLVNSNLMNHVEQPTMVYSDVNPETTYDLWKVPYLLPRFRIIINPDISY